MSVVNKELDSFEDWNAWPSSWPRHGSAMLPLGTVPLDEGIRISAQRRIAEIRRDLQQADGMKRRGVVLASLMRFLQVRWLSGLSFADMNVGCRFGRKLRMPLRTAALALRDFGAPLRQRGVRRVRRVVVARLQYTLHPVESVGNFQIRVDELDGPRVAQLTLTKVPPTESTET